MCSDALELQEGTYNGNKFVEFVTGTLIPSMCQFNGSNPRSVLTAHVSAAMQMLQDAGILVIFLAQTSIQLRNFLA